MCVCVCVRVSTLMQGHLLMKIKGKIAELVLCLRLLPALGFQEQLDFFFVCFCKNLRIGSGRRRRKKKKKMRKKKVKQDKIEFFLKNLNSK